MTFLALLLPALALAALLVNWLLVREARRQLPDGTKRERAHLVLRAWNTAGLSLMARERDQGWRVQVDVAFIDPDAIVGGDPNPKVERHLCTVPESVLWAFLDKWEDA